MIKLSLGVLSFTLILCAALDPIAGLFGGGTPTSVPVTPTTAEVTPATATLPATVEATPETTATTVTMTEGSAPDETAADTPPAPAGSETPATPSEPKISKLTFALGATADYKPISPGISFTYGITQVHAIFEYSGMASDYSWERVWYLNGDEILRNGQSWTGDQAGIFDYFIDAGNDPLSVGEWVLELYVEDELLATDSFTIEADEATPEIAKTDNSAQPTRETTPAPTIAKPTLPPSPTSAPAPTPTTVTGGGVYRLVYTKWDGGQHNLYVADTNGNNEHFLLNRAAGPSWTPDGQQIFFYGEQGIDRQTLPDGREFLFDGISNGIIALINAWPPPNTEEIQLVQNLDWKQGTARWANVSPNGQAVAFDGRPGGGDYRIFFLGTADNQQFLYEILGEQADWSPDSQRIVYRSGRDGRTGIWISNRDDTGHISITAGGSDSFPAWSPDGRTIAFSRDEAGGVDIYIMNTDGSNVRRLTDAPGPDTLPTYTPSGDIIFRSARTGSWGIWKMSGDGENEQEIIPNAGVGPDWTFSRMDVR